MIQPEQPLLCVIHDALQYIPKPSSDTDKMTQIQHIIFENEFHKTT